MYKKQTFRFVSQTIISSTMTNYMENIHIYKGKHSIQGTMSIQV